MYLKYIVSCQGWHGHLFLTYNVPLNFRRFVNYRGLVWGCQQLELKQKEPWIQSLLIRVCMTSCHLYLKLHFL